MIPKFNQNLKFNEAYLKLALIYAAIVMIISVSFSFSLYKIASNEVGKGLGKQSRIIREMLIVPQNPMVDMDQIRQQQFDEVNSRLVLNLFYFNLLILILSILISYFFAKKTLSPIEESVEAQKRFTADASHELRTPLAAMKSEIEVGLRSNKIDLNEAKGILQSNLEEIEKLEGLSGALLRLARTENQQQDFEEVDLEESILSAYEKVENLALKKSITFRNELQSLKIKGDKHSIIELFVILLDNAIKYSPAKSVIQIHMTTDKNHSIFSIKDNGIGIKSSDLSFVFNRFYRADNSRSKEKADGFGLGLSIAKQIVDLHNGEISVKSDIGKGSEFIVRF
jgi:signal transduction histidine kinase